MPTNQIPSSSFTLVAPAVMAPTPPITLEAMGPTPSTGAPLAAHVEMAETLASELRAAEADVQAVVGKAHDLVALSAAVESAGTWSRARAAAERWLANTSRGERLAWQGPQAVLGEIAPLLRLRLSSDRALAERLPAFDAFLKVRTELSKRAARTRRKRKAGAKKPTG